MSYCSLRTVGSDSIKKTASGWFFAAIPGAVFLTLDIKIGKIVRYMDKAA